MIRASRARRTMPSTASARPSRSMLLLPPVRTSPETPTAMKALQAQEGEAAGQLVLRVDFANTAFRDADLWRKLSIYVVIPCICIASVNAWGLWTEHWEHKSHEKLEDRTEYPFMNIRTKNFFWGDGDKVSIHSHVKNIGYGRYAVADMVADADTLLEPERQHPQG